MTDVVWFLVPVNPEPWAIGTVNTGRNKQTGKLYSNISPNAGLVAFQNAVKEWLEDESLPWPTNSEWKLTIYWWRQLAGNAKWCDSTNVAKAFEDALQGVLIVNDRQVRDIRSVMMAQSAEVTDPRILLKIEPFEGIIDTTTEFPNSIWEALNIFSYEHYQRWDL